MIVNIALLTVTDTRTFDNDKSGAILVKKIKEANHKLVDRKICKDNKDDIVSIFKEWTTNKEGDSFLEMEDDFSLYVSICETANKAVPRNQLTKDIFKLFVIDKNEIQEGKNIYILD